MQASNLSGTMARIDAVAIGLRVLEGGFGLGCVHQAGMEHHLAEL